VRRLNRGQNAKKQMDKDLKKEGRYSYFEAGEGTPIIILHGLMGGLSNFDGVANFFRERLQSGHPRIAHLHPKHPQDQCEGFCQIRKRFHHV
jgi:hypothetical protein